MCGEAQGIRIFRSPPQEAPHEKFGLLGGDLDTQQADRPVGVKKSTYFWYLQEQLADVEQVSDVEIKE